MKQFDSSMIAEGSRARRTLASWQLYRTRAVMEAQAPSTFLSQQIAPLVRHETVARPGEGLTFDDEVDFWSASEHLGLATVCLRRFRLSDWFPRAPGVYWSNLGQRSRAFVAEGVPEHDEELGAYYVPWSKMELVEQGGLGNVRLTPKRIDGVRCWLASASTGPQAAGAVPLAIPDSLLGDCDVTWGDTVHLTGEVRYLREMGLDDVAASVHHASPIILLVQQVRAVASHDRRDEQPLVTPVVLISAQEASGRSPGLSFGKYGYSFASCRSSQAELDDAAAWMNLYAAKHGCKVLTNFDETRPTLADAPLSYQRLVARDYDHTYIESLTLNGTLAGYIDRIDNMSNVNNVTLGTGVVIHGSLTVANSIKDSFNRSEVVPDPNLRDLLTKLASQVGELSQGMSAEAQEKVADDLATLTKELSRPAPRRQWWQLSIEGLKDAATAMGEIGAPIVKTVAELLPLLASL